jgi:hypothetical protein
MAVLRYIELKSDLGHCGPAWIARVELSKSKATVYFNGRAIRRAKGGGISGNYFDIESGEEYWVSGVKKNGEDRHWAGSGHVLVEAAALEEYLQLRGVSVLDPSHYKITHSLLPTNIAKLAESQNRLSQ